MSTTKMELYYRACGKCRPQKWNYIIERVENVDHKKGINGNRIIERAQKKLSQKIARASGNLL